MCVVLVIILAFMCFSVHRLCGFEPFFDDRGDQYMFKRILNCEYEFVSPWWDNVSLNAKDLVRDRFSQNKVPELASNKLFLLITQTLE